ncbi:DEAD/DEAH box helicase [Proteus columbae]|uniref:DEAD/DEAH box helicase n=1 Tax=Proteus columbae TaxID=1987580 RepID=UPI00288C32AA|nr:DEAD/DEAH box helicase [Proteus columbae]
MHRNFEPSILHSFVDHQIQAENHLKAEVFTNQSYDDQLLSGIIDRLQNVKSFDIAVAFVTKSGLSLLKTVLSDLSLRGITGRLLTSNYLTFNHPDTFKELLKISNLEVKISTKQGFHVKGYFFHYENYSTSIIGSSNLTATALKLNYEWNLAITSYQEGDIYKKLRNIFENEWEASELLDFDFINKYAIKYQKNKNLHQQISSISEIVNTDIIEPNKMQQDALLNLKALREQNKKKALIISATGSGKTFLSAFEIQNAKPKRMLFLAHREQILLKASASFEKIIPASSEIEYGIFSGNQKNLNANYLFATIQTLSQTEHLDKFSTDYFDYIIIDEVHKIGAASYQKILDYFKPKFLLGMTATPERTDGFNIFEMFDYNVAYEIRLKDALEMDLVAPFHYFGVVDYEFNGELIDDLSNLNYLITTERVDFLIEKIEYYGYSGDTPKGLIFCRSLDEAQNLSNEFNSRNYKTVALSAGDSQKHREDTIKELEIGKIQYIFVVDIFNEGIDIQCLNQVIMMRQTESSIVFIQQLGRGLRKYPTKEYLVVIDFIGNYQKNYLIPIALMGDNSLNKETVRRATIDPGNLYGVSNISFEKIAQERVLKAISTAKLDSARVIKKAYLDLKNRIGQIPLLLDFIINNSVDPSVIASSYKTYDDFIASMERLPIKTFGMYADAVLLFLMRELLNGKRLHEILLLETLCEQSTLSHTNYLKILDDNLVSYTEETIISVQRILNYDFWGVIERERYGGSALVIYDELSEYYILSSEIKSLLEHNQDFKTRFLDIINVAKEKNKKYSASTPLKLYERYSRKDICRLLNWHKDESSTIYGYRLKHNTLPIFTTYHKTEDLNSKVHYEDKILSPDLIKWYSKSKQTRNSGPMLEIFQSQKDKTAVIHFFIKKDDSEGTDFYYLGPANIIEDSIMDEQATEIDGGKVHSIVSMHLRLHYSIELSLYHYLIT